MSDTTPGTREELLRDLALRLSIFPGDPRNQDPQLLVGKLPDNLTLPIPIPENSRILGTLIHGPESIDVLLDSVLQPPAVMSFYKQSLTASGWNEQDEMHPAMQDGGFVHTGFHARENHATYCKGPDGPALTINAYQGKQELTDVRLDIDFGSEYSSCRQSNRMHQRMARHHAHNLIPLLEPPQGAKQQGKGGGGGGDNWHSHATLDAEMPLDVLSTHYAAQLLKGGWTQNDAGIAGPVAWSAWTFQDEENESWSGLFLILKKPGKERQYALEIRADWERKEEKRDGWFSYTSLG